MTHKRPKVKQIFQEYSKKIKHQRKYRTKRALHNMNEEVPEGLKDNIEMFFDAYKGEAPNLIINFMVIMFERAGGPVTIAQKTIARRLGLHYKTVQKITKFIATLGFFKNFAIDIYDRLTYDIDDIFFRDDIKAKIWKYIPACIKLFYFYDPESMQPIKHAPPIFIKYKSRKHFFCRACSMLVNNSQKTQKESVYDTFDVLGQRGNAIS